MSKIKTPKGQTALKHIIYDYKRNARVGNVEFHLTDEQCIQLFQLSCFYCGKEPSNIRHSRYNGSYIYNGIDRVDNNEGYIIDNVVPCCARCNHAKHTMSKEEFIELCRKIVKKHA